ncbi:MAG: DUF2807 domain-containing protein [Emcibacter sp.]|nr:DUF2807 domain-containing protein [Emcibacter sp.]
MNYLKLLAIATFAIGAILYLAAADEHDVVVGDQDYDLGEYVKITVNSAVDIKVRAGGEYGLNVKADEADLKKLKIYVKGKTLVIENKKAILNSWNGTPPEIMISLPLLQKFTLNSSSEVEINHIHGSFFKVMLNGSGSILFDGASDVLYARINGSGTIDSGSFDVKKEAVIVINGSGDMSLAGDCRNLEIEINGSGDFTGRDFTCEKVEVDVAGSGDLDVYASVALDVDIIGSGNVNVFGKPEHVKDRSREKNHVTIK